MSAGEQLKILLLDIETAPNLAYVWGLFKENIPIARIVNSGYVLSWAAKWLGKREIKFNSVQRKKPRKMLRDIHTLLDEADVVIHYNGKSFDIPTLNKEFIKAGMKPPAPYKQLDLMRVVKKEFRFPSNKLDYVLQALGIGKKVRHPGFEMWVKCMAGDRASWRNMERYNKGDVRELEKLYDRLLPWIQNHPSHAAVTDGNRCPNCGGTHLQRRGSYPTRVLRFPRFRCMDCGKWSRSNKPLNNGKREHIIGV